MLGIEKRIKKKTSIFFNNFVCSTDALSIIWIILLLLCSLISLHLLSSKKNKKSFLFLYFKICYLHDSGLWMLEGGVTHRSLGF